MVDRLVKSPTSEPGQSGKPETAAQAARAWRAGLSGTQRRSTVLRGGGIFALSAVAYLALFCGPFLLPTWWMRGLCLMTTPIVIGALFVIGHDAAHHSLTPIGWLNQLLGRLAMLPAWHPFTSWRHAHNTLHHGGTCLKGKHPDFPPFSKEEYDRLPWLRRTAERIYRTPLGIGLYYTIDFYWRYLLFPRRELRAPQTRCFHLDRLLILAFLAGQLVLSYLLGGLLFEQTGLRWGYAVVTVFVPWITWIWFMGFVSFIQHTHPETVWYDNETEWSYYTVQLQSSTHVKFPWPIELLLHNIMDHPAHHIDPTIPLYELPASQKLLEESAPEHSLVVPFNLSTYLRICRSCKLYDYRRRCWLNFQGEPTTQPRRQEVPTA